MGQISKCKQLFWTVHNSNVTVKLIRFSNFMSKRQPYFSFEGFRGRKLIRPPNLKKKKCFATFLRKMYQAWYVLM